MQIFSKKDILWEKFINGNINISFIEDFLEDNNQILQNLLHSLKKEKDSCNYSFMNTVKLFQSTSNTDNNYNIINNDSNTNNSDNNMIMNSNNNIMNSNNISEQIAMLDNGMMNSLVKINCICLSKSKIHL